MLDAGGLGAAAASDSIGNVAIAWWLPAPCCSAFSSGISLASGSGNTFTNSSVSSNDYAFPSLAFDGSGVLHIAAYIQGGSGGLEYLEDNAGVVSETLVDATPLNDRPSLRVAPSGQVRVATATATGISFATLSSGVWTSSEIWTGFAIGPHLAIDSAGKNHIVWATQDLVTGSPAGFFYATDATGSWVVSRLSTSQDDVSPTIAVDSVAVVHIVYVRTTRHREALLELRGGTSWKSVTLVRGAVDVPEIVIGPNNSENIAYSSLEQKTPGLHFLTNASGRFVDSTADAGAFDNGPLALAVTPSGTAYISYLVPGSCCPATGGLFVIHD
jgi:hypothetical protein